MVALAVERTGVANGSIRFSLCSNLPLHIQKELSAKYDGKNEHYVFKPMQPYLRQNEYCVFTEDVLHSTAANTSGVDRLMFYWVLMCAHPETKFLRQHLSGNCDIHRKEFGWKPDLSEEKQQEKFAEYFEQKCEDYFLDHFIGNQSHFEDNTDCPSRYMSGFEWIVEQTKYIEWLEKTGLCQVQKRLDQLSLNDFVVFCNN